MSEVSLPLNIDDVDLYPEVTELPTTRPGWTPMKFSLINIDLIKTMQRLAATASSSSPSFSSSEDVRKQIISETRARVEERLAHCNPVIPQHRLTIHCSRFLLRKLDFITRQQSLLIRNSGPTDDFTSEKNLIEALEILQPRFDSEDDMLKQFSWARKAYPQYHITRYILWYLCIKPEGAGVDRALEAMDTLFCGQNWEQLISGFGSMSAVVVILQAKAIAVREKIHTRNQAGTRYTATVV